MSDYEEDFFEGKRPWSVIKDQVLNSYMSPYLNKVKSLQKPILLIDGFAGPGVFDDQSPVHHLPRAKRLRNMQRVTIAHSFSIINRTFTKN